RVGSVEVEVAASSEMMPGVVSLPHGWGHARPGVQLAIARAQASTFNHPQPRVDSLPTTGHAIAPLGVVHAPFFFGASPCPS
ncbi:hypothetical protein, partial [Pseudomonas aeruginosa]|uniref:hypothetical protein n=1 Tax=Pseudomonas aeruginosa TaxID=287 RepID=UPI00295508C8